MPVTDSPTPNLFWGIVLKSDKRYEQAVEESFHISKACLEPTQSTGKICSVYLEQDNEEFILCNLSDNNLNESLDLNFTETEKICFRVEGGGTVHLTGYLIPEDDEMFPVEDMSDEEEEEIEEETPPTLVKKRKLENGNSPKGDKKPRKEDEIKQAEAMKKLLVKGKASKGSAEDSEDESSGDDDSEEDELDSSEVTDGSSFFDSTAMEEDDDSEDGEDEEDSDEDDDGEEEDSDESVDNDAKKQTPDKKVGKKNEVVQNKPTPKSKDNVQKNETPKSLKKEKTATPQSVKQDKKPVTPAQKKENKQDNKTDTPVTKKDKKNKQLQNGGTPNGLNTPSAQTPKGKDIKTPAKDQQSAQTPNKTPKRQLKGGVVVEDLKIGNGPEAHRNKRIGMYYEGKLKSNNKQFDACKEGKPFLFNLGKGEVIKGWDIGVEGMKVGGKRRLTLPPHMAYGAQGAPPDIPPNSALVFEIECKFVK